jgi:hypothetical protein
VRRALLAVLVLAAVLAGLASFEPPPTTLACVTTQQACPSGTCTGNTPDAGSDAGSVPLYFLRSYFLRVCAPASQTLSGAGNLLDYHCAPDAGVCSEVKGNRYAVTTSSARCEESTTFTVPYVDTTGDWMTWVASGITVSGTDGGALSVTVCPQK